MSGSGIGMSFTTGQAAELARPIYRLLIAADLGGIPGSPLQRLREASDLADIMSTMAPSVSALSVPNRLASEPATLTIDLTFRGLREFEPLSVAKQVPELDMALQLRSALKDAIKAQQTIAVLHDLLAPYERFDALVNAARFPAAQSANGSAPVTTPGADDLSVLEDLLAESDSTKQASLDDDPARAAIKAFALGTGTSANAGKRPRDLEASLAAVENVILLQLKDIFALPAVRHIEATWLGLRFLVREGRWRDTACIDLVQARVADLPERLAEIETSDDQPPTLLLIAQPVGSSTVEVNALEELLRRTEEWPCAVAVEAGPSLFGVEDFAALSERQDPGLSLSRAGMERWSAFCGKAEANQAMVLANRFTVREARTAGERAVGFSVDQTTIDEPLYASPVLLLARQVLKSLSDTGWPTALTGAQNGLEGLELAPVEAAHEAVLPLEAAMTADQCENLADAGIASYCARLNRDMAFLPYVPTAAGAGFSQHERSEGRNRFQHQLGAQWVERAIAEHLHTVRQHPEPAARLRQLLRHLVSDTGPGADATVTENGEGGVDVVLRPGRATQLSMTFEFSLAL